MHAFLYGFLGAFAALFLLALVRRLRWRRMARAGGPPRFLLRGLFRRLRTRPDQETLLTAEADALAAELRSFRREGRALREELAALLEAPSFDPAALQGALGPHLERLSALQRRAGEAFARAHAALDEGQRRALAELLRRGHRRHAHACR